MKLYPERLKKSFLTKTNSEYEIIGEYKGALIKAEILHHTCGNTFLQKPNVVLNLGNSCPTCKKAKNFEKKFNYAISFFTKDKNFKFISSDKENNTIKAWHQPCDKISIYTEDYLYKFSPTVKLKCYACKDRTLRDLGKESFERKLKERSKGMITVKGFGSLGEPATFHCTACKDSRKCLPWKIIEKPMCKNIDCKQSYIYKKRNNLLTKEEIETFDIKNPTNKGKGPIKKAGSRTRKNRKRFDFPEGVVIVTKDKQKLTTWSALVEYNKWHPNEGLLKKYGYLHPDKREKANVEKIIVKPKQKEDATSPVREKQQDYNNIQWTDSDGNPVDFKDLDIDHPLAPQNNLTKQLSKAEKEKITKSRKDKKKQKKNSQKKNKKKKKR